MTVVDERLIHFHGPPLAAVHGLHTGWSALLLCRQESHGPDLVQAAITCQCQPQSLKNAQCFVFALTLACKELSDDQRFHFKP